VVSTVTQVKVIFTLPIDTAHLRRHMSVYLVPFLTNILSKVPNVPIPLVFGGPVADENIVVSSRSSASKTSSCPVVRRCCDDIFSRFGRTSAT